ncbi:hypothetical protein MRF4_29260 [Methylobacterium radiotolerans]|uniref:hypothetical protein n=1 Tax=Methylobacterium TaxID=407 RepID=UPI002F31B4B6
MSDKELKGEQVAWGIMAQGQLSRLQSYLERGRKLEGLSEELLQARWIEAARMWGQAPFDPATAMDEITAEYTLRKVEPPYDLVKDDIEKAITAITARTQEMSAEELNEANAAMVADYEKGSRSRN